MYADLQLRRRRDRRRPNYQQDERLEGVHPERRRTFPALPHVLRHRNTKRAALRGVRFGIQEESGR